MAALGESGESSSSDTDDGDYTEISKQTSSLSLSFVPSLLDKIGDINCDLPSGSLSSPKGLSVDTILYNFQLDGFRWLHHAWTTERNMILCDSMGLGKTIQTIALMADLRESAKIPGPFLVVCPLGVSKQWCSEIKRFAPNLIPFHFVGLKKEREVLRKKIVSHIMAQVSLSPHVLSL